MKRASRQFENDGVASDVALLAAPRDERSLDVALDLFERRAAALNADPTELRLFSLRSVDDFDDASRSGEFERLSVALNAGGSMPPDVGEECVRRLFAAVRSAHAERWSHGALSLDFLLLDCAGEVRVCGVGVRQREELRRLVEQADRDGLESDALDGLWREAFVVGAAEDFRRLAKDVVAPIADSIDGERPAWVVRLTERLDSIDGTIAEVEDVDLAWRALEAAFASDVASNEEATERESSATLAIAAPEAAIDETAQDLRSEEVRRELDSGAALSTIRALLPLWIFLLGGLAALACALVAIVSAVARSPMI